MSRDNSSVTAHAGTKMTLVLRNIIIIGGGSYASVVLDLIKAINVVGARYMVKGFYADDAGSNDLNISHLGTIRDFKQQAFKKEAATESLFVACIEENIIREKLVTEIDKSVFSHSPISWATLIHPDSRISQSAAISEGCVICAGAVVGHNAKIGSHVIVNTNVSVGSNCDVGAFVHIGPGVHLAEYTIIDKLTFLNVESKKSNKVWDGRTKSIENADDSLNNTTDSYILENPTSCEKISEIEAKHDKICWLPKKSVNFSRIEQVLAESIKQNHFANCGPCVLKFEEELRDKLEIDQTKAVILTCNGSAALHAIIGGLEIFYAKKLKFATQAFTFPTSVQGTLVGSAVIDVDNYGGLDIDQLDGETIDGIVVTNVFGHIVDIKKYTDWANRFKKLLVFDNAATSYTFYHGRNSLNFGDSTFLSFHHTKPVGFGEGGAIIIDRKYEAAVRQCINFGYDVVKGDVRWRPEGSNYKMSDVQAAFIYAYLDQLDMIIKAHVFLYDRVKKKLDTLNIGVRMMPNFSSGTPFVSCFPILFQHPIHENVIKEIALESSIELRKYYKPLLITRDAAPNANYFYDHIVCFPCHWQMTDESVNIIISIIQDIHRKTDI